MKLCNSNLSKPNFVIFKKHFDSILRSLRNLKKLENLHENPICSYETQETAKRFPRKQKKSRLMISKSITRHISFESIRKISKSLSRNGEISLQLHCAYKHTNFSYLKILSELHRIMYTQHIISCMIYFALHCIRLTRIPFVGRLVGWLINLANLRFHVDYRLINLMHAK